MLILCEKPSVAKDFAKALNVSFSSGYFSSKDGSIKITSCLGHLFELAPPDFYDEKYKKWSLSDLPIIPTQYQYLGKKDAKKQIELVSSLLKSETEKVIIATDADREGELIARLVVEQSGIKNLQNYYRFWASEALTPDVVKKELKNVKPWIQYETLYQQAKARQHSDWLVGMNLSRYVSCGNNRMFSVGRVQTAVLSVIAARNLAIKNFKPKPYHTLTAEIFDKDKNQISATLINPKDNKTSFELNDDYLKNAFVNCKNAKINNVDVKTVQKVNHAPELLSTTGLQKLASKLYDLSPNDTLKAMQVLYENHKCLSYPRTPSCVMGDDNVELVKSKFELLKDFYPELSKYSKIEKIDSSNKRLFNSKKLEAHHALIPLAQIPDSATNSEKKVFEIVVKNFFQSLMDDNIIEEKQLIFDIKGYKFKSTISFTKQDGWKVVENNKDLEEQNDIQAVKSFDEESSQIQNLKLNEKFTTPPKEFTEESILSFMENPKSEKTNERLVGLGTAATRHTIIKTLFDRKFITKKAKKIYATEDGFYLCRFLSKNEELAKLLNVNQTTEWEKLLDANPTLFEQNITNYIKKCCSIEKNKEDVFVKTEIFIGKCPLCNRNIKESNKNWYCIGYKENPSCNFSIWKEVSGAKLSETDAKTLLLGKKTGLKKMKSKAGKNFSARLFLSKGEIQFDFENKKGK